MISGLSYNPSAAYANSGGGQVTVSGSINFTNASIGVASVTIAVLDAVGAIVSTNITPVPNGSGATTGMVVGTVSASTSVVGNYTIRVTLRDLAGRDSNALTGSFRIATAPWVAKAAMPRARQYFAVAASGGRAYVIGGELLGTGTTPGPDSAVVDVYDPASDTWATGIQMPTARKAPIAATVNGVIYVIGGRNLGAPGGLSTVEAFDPSTGLWSAKTSMPTPRSGAAAAVINGQICVFGGTSGGLHLATTECFDPLSNSWIARPPMPSARSALGADSIGAFAYAVGGAALLSPNGYLATVERFDPAGPSWSATTSMQVQRESAGVVAASGLLYAIGGANNAPVLDSVEAFDPSSSTWTSKTPLPLALTRLGAVAIGAAIYVFEQGHSFRYTPADDIL